MKVFGQEQLLGPVPVDKMLTLRLSLPVSLASIGMPRVELIEQNAGLAQAFKPMSAEERQRVGEVMDLKRQTAFLRFLAGHADV